MLDLNSAEDDWCIGDPVTYSSFENLPMKARWFARCITPPGQSKPTLEVFTDSQIHCLPETYAGPLMLLSLQELSCIAEAFLVTASKMKTQLWQNVHFLWSLRETILMNKDDQEDRIHPLLERWVIRLIHRVGNSISNRRQSDEKLKVLYNQYHHEVGKLEIGGSKHTSDLLANIILSF
jgi:hypothetical protein